MTEAPTPASEPAPPSGGGAALLEVRDLRVYFPITRGAVFRRTVGHVHAVDGITLGLGAGETVIVYADRGRFPPKPSVSVPSAAMAAAATVGESSEVSPSLETLAAAGARPAAGAASESNDEPRAPESATP